MNIKQIFTGNIPSKNTENVYLSAKNAYNSDIQNIFSEKRSWQLATFFFMFLCLLLLASLLHLNGKSQYTPYIIAVDKIGTAVITDALDQPSDLPPHVIQATLASFVNNWRKVTPDTSLQRNLIFSVYAMIEQNSTASIKMNDFYKDIQVPFELAKTMTKEVDIISVIPLSSSTWQIDFDETTRTREGKTISIKRFRSVITIEIKIPDKKTTLQEIKLNPVGLFITDFHYTEQL